MIDNTRKLYTMMVEAYWVTELKHELLSPQDRYTEERNATSFQNYSGFEGGDIFSKLMVNPKVKGYHRQPALHTTKMKYNCRNNLPIHSTQLTHAQNWKASILEAAICETSTRNKKLTAAHRELLQWHFRLGHIGFSHICFLART